MDSKKKAFLISLVRKGTYKWRPRNECLAAARVERGKYKCNECEEIVGRKEIQVDHIVPCVDPIKGWQGFEDYLDKMFCDLSGFQALCISCHKIKTKSEVETRSAAKKSKKKLDK